MLSPVQANTYTPGDFIPITWQSYFVSGNKVSTGLTLALALGADPKPQTPNPDLTPQTPNPDPNPLNLAPNP